MRHNSHTSTFIKYSIWCLSLEIWSPRALDEWNYLCGSDRIAVWLSIPRIQFRMHVCKSHASHRTNHIRHLWHKLKTNSSGASWAVVCDSIPHTICSFCERGYELADSDADQSTPSGQLLCLNKQHTLCNVFVQKKRSVYRCRMVTLKCVRTGRLPTLNGCGWMLSEHIGV